MTVGGVLKELNETEEEDGAKVKFLEALYLYEHWLEGCVCVWKWGFRNYRLDLMYF